MFRCGRNLVEVAPQPLPDQLEAIVADCTGRAVFLGMGHAVLSRVGVTPVRPAADPDEYITGEFSVMSNRILSSGAAQENPSLTDP